MNEKMKVLYALLEEMYPDMNLWEQVNDCDDDTEEIVIGVGVPIFDNGQRGTGEKLGDIAVWFCPDGIKMYDPIEDGEWV